MNDAAAEEKGNSLLNTDLWMCLDVPGIMFVNPSPYKIDFFHRQHSHNLYLEIAFSHVNRFLYGLNVTFNIFRKPFWGN